METLNFRFENERAAGNAAARPSVQTQLVGVVGSGNLAVLIEPVALNGACEVQVQTAVRGFDAFWQAVIDDFNHRWVLTDARLSINDMGATPAVVSLRLDQAVESALGTRQQDRHAAAQRGAS